MIEKLGVLLADSLILTGKICQEEKEICVYGLELLCMNIFNLATAAVIGAVLGQVMECFLFLALFVPLRSYAGGYHAKSSLRCYFLSGAVMTAVLLLLRQTPEIAGLNLNLPLLFCSSGIVAFLAPVENENKPLDLKEKQVYGRRARCVLAVETFIGIVCHTFFYSRLSWLVTLTVLIMAITVLSGIIQNLCLRRTKRRI